jgi:hypothetical protein
MANEPRVPRIALPSDYYSNFGALKIQSGTPNDPGFLDIIPPKTMNPMGPGLRMYPPANLADTGGRVRVADNGLEAFLGGLFNPAARDQNQRMLEASRAANIYKPYGGAQSSMRSALSASGGGRPNTDAIINGTFGSMNPDALVWPGVSASGIHTGPLSPPAVVQYGGGGSSGGANWMDSANPVPPAKRPLGRAFEEWVTEAAYGNGALGRLNAAAAANPPAFNVPVENMTPELAAAVADVKAGKPGALENYGKLLADASGTGNIGTSSVPQRRGGLFGMLFGGNAGGSNRGLFGMVNAPRAPRAPNTYTPATSVSGNTGYRNERTGVLHTSDKGRQYGTTSSGQRTDYGASPGQKTAGLKPGDRVYDADTNSWGLK